MHKLIVSKFIASLSTVILAFAVATSGQGQTGVMKVNVPFGFESGTTHFAPGVYSIHLDGARPFIRIEGQKSSAFQMTIKDSAARAPERGKLVFRRYGSQYILKEVWVAGSTSYLRTPKSKVEKELELAQANKSQQGSLALVAARL
jgi:hypothetical protein